MPKEMTVFHQLYVLLFRIRKRIFTSVKPAYGK